MKARLLLTFATVVIAVMASGQNGTSWADAMRQKKGSITVFWYESKPFIYTDAGRLTGIELDLLEGFKRFLKSKRGVDLTIDWKEADSFSHAYRAIREGDRGADLAASAFSITQQRRAEVGFSPPYMSDLSVLITSDNVPVLADASDLNALLPHLTAVTIEGTTYEQELLRLKKQGGMNFRIRYIPSSENIMLTIAATDSAFGFIDLPVYMMLFNEDPSMRVRRQNLLPIKREGYGIIFPQGSDWAGPLAEYFNHPGFRNELETIISRYIDLDLYRLVEGLAVAPGDDVIRLLTKEKEIQYRNLLGKTEKIIRETRMRNFLAVLVFVVMFFLVIIISLYRKRNEQNLKIELQRKNIEAKSRELEQRNTHLMTLDEEKNNLIKILAHDLRTPIHHIQGMAQIVLLENKSLPEEQKAMIRQITDSAVRLSKMISHLLDIDALENNRVNISIEELSLVEIVEKVVESFESEAANKNLQISFLRPATTPVIRADAIFLYEILENLISNAIKFSEREKKISISVGEQDEYAIVHVRDEGPGLTAQDMEGLFKKFSRLSAKPTAGEGSVGLGLSIVKKYVESMGGDVWCTSSPGEGSTFSVSFIKAPLRTA